MGTRHLICVFANGEYKVAQYGQWDGYPEGQGSEVLNFLLDTNMEAFRERISHQSWATKEEVEEAWKNAGADGSGLVKMDIADKLEARNPEYSRNTSSHILKLIMERDLRLQNSLRFAADSLFCEWAYVIDLDKNTLEVYEGFNKEPLTELDRFYFDGEFDGKYYPVKLAQTFSLNSLPSRWEFINCFTKER